LQAHLRGHQQEESSQEYKEKTITLREQPISLMKTEASPNVNTHEIQQASGLFETTCLQNHEDQATAKPCGEAVEQVKVSAFDI